MKAGDKVNGAFVTNKNVSKRTRLAVHNGVLVSTLRVANIGQKKHESRINAVLMRPVRSMCDVKISDAVRIVVLRERCGLKKDVLIRIEKDMHRWFGHLESVLNMYF